MGLLWVTFFNFNGIGPLIFYAGSLFNDESRSASLAIVFTVFAVTSGIGILPLLHFGRKTLVIVNQTVVICAMFCLWFFKEVEEN